MVGANGVAGTCVTTGGVTGTDIAAGTAAVASGVDAVALPRPLRIVIVTGVTTAGVTAADVTAADVTATGVTATGIAAVIAGVSAAGMLTLSLDGDATIVPDGVNVAL